MPRDSSSISKPNAKFFLVGEGPLRESLEAQARRSASAIDSCSSDSRATSPPC